MTSLTQSPVSFSSRSASDLLRCSANGINGVPLKTLGRARFGTSRRRDLVISAKIKKGKKHDYPWPDEIDPNVKGGVVSYLSHFKPLKEQPKLATLEFEKPLMALQKKITDVRKMAADTGLDFGDQINSLESKYQQALQDLYKHLTPHQRLTLARHPNRPTCLDHVISITDQWVELHGDRAGYDDPAIVTGIGRIDGVSYMFIGQQKGRNTKENIHRNFAMPTPHGYRKALRMMLYADHHGFPIITFIDTPGALADLKSEELGQGEAIAYNLRTMFGLKVPIISVVIGEGGSGGALAIGCANKLLILENAVFYVASPEACAAILWKDSKASPRAAECLRITASDLQRLKIVDGIIPEPVGGAHNDPTWTSQQIKMAILDSMEELSAMDTTQLLEHRRLKFRNLGEVIEGVQIDPAKKINMRRDDEPANQMEEPDSSSDLGLEDQIEKLKDQILKVKESSSPKPILGLNEMIEKLKKEVDQEFLEAVNSMGFKDRLDTLREEVTKARSSTDQLIDTGLKDKIEKLGQEFKQGLSQAPNIDSLNYKLNMLKELSKAKKISEQGEKVERLKQEINKGFAEVLSRSDLKEKIMKLNEEIKNLDVSTGQDLDPELMEKIKTAKQEIECEMVGALKSLNLEVEVVAPKEEASEGGEFEEQKISEELKAKVEEFDKEINEEIEKAVNSSDLKNMIETLKMEEAKAGILSDPDSKSKIEQMKQTIKQRIAEALSSSGLMEKYEKLKQESAAVLINEGD